MCILYRAPLQAQLPSVSLSLDNTEISEAGGKAVVTARLSQVSDRDVKIVFKTQGLARYQLDYDIDFSGKGSITTVAGGNGAGYGRNQLFNPTSLFIDSLNALYISDSQNFRVQKWELGATEGTTVAGGNGNGQADDQLGVTAGIWIDSKNNLYIADKTNGRIQKWPLGAKKGETVAGGNGFGTGANQFRSPVGIYVDTSGIMYIADEFNHRIQKWILGENTGTTVAGGRGLGNGESQIAEPTNVMLDPDGNILVSNLYAGVVKKWFPGNPLGIPVAGRFFENLTLTLADDFHLDQNGSFYISDGNSNIVQKWLPGAKNGIIIAGNGVGAENLIGPKGVFCDRALNVYIADHYNHRVVQVLFQPKIIIPAGQLTGTLTIFSLNDAKLEDNEVIELVIERVEHAEVASSSNQVNITLLEDDEVPSSVLLGSPNKIILEENGPLAYPVRLSKKQGKKAQVQVRFSGTAILGVDYQVNKQEVSFAPEDSTESILITPINNSLIEEKKSILISVIGGNHIDSPYPSDTLWLLSDDQPTISQLLSDQTILSESAGKVTLRATLSKPHSRDVVITLRLEGSANYQHDFEADFLSKGNLRTAVGVLGRGNGLDQLFTPLDVTVDSEDNLYISDSDNYRIQKWKKGALEGEIRVEGGKELGIPKDFWYKTFYWMSISNNSVFHAAENASEKNKLSPSDIFVDKKGSLFVRDSFSNSVKKWLKNETEYTVLLPRGKQSSDGNQSSRLDMMSVDKQENLYVLIKNQIEKWAPNASVGQPIRLNPIANKDFSKSTISGFSIDQLDNLYVVFQEEHVVGKWDLRSGIGKIVAGEIGRPGAELNRLNSPSRIFVDDQGVLFIIDHGNKRIQKWFPGALQANTVAGSGIPSHAKDSLGLIYGLTEDSQKNLYMSQQDGHRILKVLFQPQIVIPAGQTSGSLTFTALDDVKFEGTESFEWIIESIENAILPKGPLENKITLVDNDQPPMVLLENKKTLIPEEKGEYQYPVRLSNKSGKSIPIELGFSGTAQLGTDYLVDKQQLVFAPEDSVEWLTITPLNDAIIELKESIIISVVGGENISKPFPSDTIWIESDELPKVVAFEIDQTTIPESNGKGVLTATLSELFDRDVTVILKPKGSATHFSDYDTDFLGKKKYHVAAGGLGLGYTPKHLNYPRSIHIDKKDNLYVVNGGSGSTQKWTPRASQGIQVLGVFGTPQAIWVDDEEYIFLADPINHQVAKGNIKNSNFTVVAGGNGYGSNANQLSYPWDIVIDPMGSLYISDHDNNRIQKWEKNAKEGKTVVNIKEPSGLSLDFKGNLYVAELTNHVVKKWAPGAIDGVRVAGGVFPGRGPNQLIFPTSIFVNELGDVFINDLGNNRTQKWAVGANTGETVLRVEDLSDVVVDQFTRLGDISVDSFGNVYIVDQSNHRVLKVIYQPQIVIPAGQKSGSLTITSKQDRTFEGDEWIEWEIDTIFNATLSTSIPLPKVEIKDQDTAPVVLFGSKKTFLSEDDPTVSYPIRLSHKSSRKVTVQLNFSGTAEVGVDYQVDKKVVTFDPGDTLQTVVFSHVKDQVVDPVETIVIQVLGGENIATPYPTDTLWIASDEKTTVASLAFDKEKISEANGQTTLTATLSQIHHKDIIISFNRGGDAQYLDDYSIDFDLKNNVEIVAGGNGYGTADDQLHYPKDFFVTPDQTIYVADGSWVGRIQKWVSGAEKGSTVAGGNGHFSGVSLNLLWQLERPTGVVVDSLGNIYVADSYNDRVQKFSRGSKDAITVAGGNGRGDAPNQLFYPSGIFLDQQGNLWVSDEFNHRVQKFLPGSQVGITVAGGNGAGDRPNQLKYPDKIKVDQQGNLYITDSGNHRIQRWSPGAKEGITVAGGNGGGNRPNQFNHPADCWVLENGDLLIADGRNRRIQKWTQGAKEGFTVPMVDSLGFPLSLSMDSKGNLFVLDNYKHTVFKMPFEPKLIIPAGQLSSSLTITARDDQKMEEDEVVQFDVKKIERASLSGPFPSARLTIQDNDLPPKVLLGDSVQTLLEEIGTIEYPIRLSNRTSKPVKVQLEFSGTAIQDVDYRINKQVLEFSPEDSVEFLSITPLNDTDIEVLKSLLITVVGGVNISSQWPADTLWVSSDDKPTVSGLAWDRSSISEANGQATLTARLSVPHSRDVYVALKSVGSAKYERDFVANFGGKESVRSVVGGRGKGNATHQLSNPTDLQVDSLGIIYVLDIGNLQISRWEPGNNQSVTAFKFPNQEWFEYPGDYPCDTNSISLDHQNQLYFPYPCQHSVYKVVGIDGETVIVAGGNGKGAASNQLANPTSVFVDRNGAVYVADAGNVRIQKWAPGAKEGVTVAGGNGYGLAANQVAFMNKIWVDLQGNVFILDEGLDGESYKKRISMWAPGARQGVTKLSYEFNHEDLARGLISNITNFFVNGAGEIIYVESPSGLIKKISSNSETLPQVIADVHLDRRRHPYIEYRGLDFDADGNIFVLENSLNPQVWKVQMAPQIVIPAGQLEGSLQLTALSDIPFEGNKLAQFEVSYLENGVRGSSLPKEVRIEIGESRIPGENPFKSSDSDWVVYPNPSTELFYLKTEGSRYADVTIRLFESATNKQVFSTHFEEVNGKGVPIQMESRRVKPGNYYLLIETRENRIIKHIHLTEDN